MSRLLDQLPPVRGRLVADAPVAPLTWFRVGGPAEVLFQPADSEDLVEFLAALPPEVPVTAIGVGSNLLVRDGGIKGVLLRLPRADITVADDEVRAPAGALDLHVAAAAARAGLAGLEFLSGIPGTVGGGFRTNSGAYGTEFKDVLVRAEAVDRHGRRHEADAAGLGLAYRHAEFPADWIVVGARFRGTPGDPAAIAARLRQVQASREASQPIRSRTGGSTFANPAGRRAWELIDQAGCRGLKHGGAMVSEKHANFLINTGSATAADIENLGEEVRRRVYERFGVQLAWEIRRVGDPLPGAAPSVLPPVAAA